MSTQKSEIPQASSSSLSKSLRDKLSKQHACYVLITCNHPDEKGNMQVEMTYEGDACLAAMLIDNAQGYLQDDLAVQNAK